MHLIRFHGVLAPNAKLRPRVVPQGPLEQEEPATEAVLRPPSARSRLSRHGRTALAGARLLKCVFDIDMEHCPNCGGGELKIIAAILERPVIEKISTHLGLNPRHRPEVAPVRSGNSDAT
ncbi:MAG: hypothetical protein U1E61_24175 [Bradyrhizobium sp.]